jgi:hypothetical protein
MTTEDRARNVVALHRHREVTPAPPPLAVDPAPRRARCAGCMHWVPADRPGRAGRCFGHHRLPATTGCDGCSAWRRRPLRCIS